MIPYDPSLAPAFLTPLRAEYLANERWMICEPLLFRSLILDRLIVVPARLVLDFASVPRWLPIA